MIPFGKIKDHCPNKTTILGTNTLGTLVGDIISQRALDLVVSRRPQLTGVITDFSSTPARLNQTIYTRNVGLPTVQNFGSAASATDDTDYTVTLDQHKQTLYTFTAAEIEGTTRDLVGEHSEALAVALGNSMVDAVAALITDAFTSETVVASSSVDFTTIAGVTKTLNNAGAPDSYRFGWVNEDVAEALKNDEVVVLNYDSSIKTSYGHWINLMGFRDVWEFPALPANSVNLTGFFGSRNTLIIAARPPFNPAELAGVEYPGSLRVITDPVSGLSVMNNIWIDQASLAINARMIVIYGVARGNVAGGHKLVSS